MTSRRKRKIALTNGAKAAGAKSAQGIQTLSRKALRLGLTSQTLVLANECPKKFGRLLQSYVEKFQPQDDVEMSLVEKMVAARWCLQRVWGIQTAALEREMIRQQDDEAVPSPEQITEPARCASAFRALAKDENTMALYLRHETSYSRTYQRALKELNQMRENQNLRNDPDPAPLQPQVPDQVEANANLQNDPNSVETPLQSVTSANLRNDPKPSPTGPPVVIPAPRDGPTYLTPPPPHGKLNSL